MHPSSMRIAQKNEKKVWKIINAFNYITKQKKKHNVHISFLLFFSSGAEEREQERGTRLVALIRSSLVTHFLERIQL